LITSLRPGISALFDGENLDLAVAHRDNVACCFTDQSPRKDPLRLRRQFGRPGAPTIVALEGYLMPNTTVPNSTGGGTT
jgi:hypothetical protein